MHPPQQAESDRWIAFKYLLILAGLIGAVYWFTQIVPKTK
jgi:hypothetical protein